MPDSVKRSAVKSAAVQEGRCLLFRGEFLGGLGLLRLRGGDRLRMAKQVLPQVLLTGVQAFEIGEKVFFLLPIHSVHRVVVGRLPGDGEAVAPGHALLLAELNETQNGLVAVVLRREKRGVKGQVVGGTVADQGSSVSVGDDAPGGLHLLCADDGTDGLSRILLIVNNLHVIEHEQVGGQHQHQEGGQQIEAGVLHFLAVHWRAFLL